jgi:hypothetical protein
VSARDAQGRVVFIVVVVAVFGRRRRHTYFPRASVDL